MQEFGSAVTCFNDAATQLQGAVDELFGPRGEAPGGSADGFQRVSFRPPGRLLPAPRSTGGGRSGGGSISGGLLSEADAEFEDFRDKVKGALGEIDAAAQTTFRRIEGFMVHSLETGKFEWRGLADAAIRSIRDILDEQLRASGVSSSLFGGGGGGILGSLFQIGAGFLGPAAGGGASSAALSTALSLSGPRFQFAHGGRPPVGKASLVGEEGPELFIPDSLGEIVPNDRLGGANASMTVNVTQNFDFRGADLAAVAALRRESVRIKREVLAEILASASRGGTFARMARV